MKPIYLANQIFSIYSDLEMIFVEQDISRTSLEITQSPELDQIQQTSFEKNIAQFLEKVRFS